MTVFYFDVLIIAVDGVVNNAGIVVSSTTPAPTLSTTKLSTLSLMTLFVKLLPIEGNLNFTLLVVCANKKDLQSQLMGAKHSFL